MKFYKQYKLPKTENTWKADVCIQSRVTPLKQSKSIHQYMQYFKRYSEEKP